MPERHVIASRGRYRWQLAVCDGHVTASRHLPTADGSWYYTTADFGLTSYDNGADNRSVDQVVSDYHTHAHEPERSYSELLEAVREALRDVPTTDHQTAESPA